MSSRHTNLILSFSEADVKRLHENAAAALEGGKMVISEAVTNRLVNWLFNVSFDEIAAAGVSGLGINDGVLVNNAGLFIGDGYSGKLSGKIPAGAIFPDGSKAAEAISGAPMVGISGYAGNNYTCLFRALCGGICSKCFSLLTPWKPSIKAWSRNDVILSSFELTSGDVILDPVKIPFVRFSSHGDLINATHGFNYLRIAADNPDVNFALWTKNAQYMREAFRMFGGVKPSNLTLIYSPLRMNVIPSETALTAAKNAGYDAIFSVFEKRDNQAAAIAAGAHFCKCGDASCRHLCQFCYNPARRSAFDPSKAVLIAEILDGEKHSEK